MSVWPVRARWSRNAWANAFASLAAPWGVDQDRDQRQDVGVRVLDDVQRRPAAASGVPRMPGVCADPLGHRLRLDELRLVGEIACGALDLAVGDLLLDA